MVDYSVCLQGTCTVMYVHVHVLKVIPTCKYISNYFEIQQSLSLFLSPPSPPLPFHSSHFPFFPSLSSPLLLPFPPIPIPSFPYHSSFPLYPSFLHYRWSTALSTSLEMTKSLPTSTVSSTRPSSRRRGARMTRH